MDDATPPNLDIGGARANILRFAARLFACEVDAGLLSDLAAAQRDGAFGSSDLVVIDSALLTLRPEAALEELAVEYCRLFVGPEPVCAPYASAHRKDILHALRAAEQLETFGARYGLAFSSDSRVAAVDHIAIVLSLLAALEDPSSPFGELSRDASSARVALRQILTDEGLLAWVPRYLRSVVAEARFAPYRTVPALAAALLDQVDERQAGI